MDSLFSPLPKFERMLLIVLVKLAMMSSFRLRKLLQCREVALVKLGPHSLYPSPPFQRCLTVLFALFRPFA